MCACPSKGLSGVALDGVLLVGMSDMKDWHRSETKGRWASGKRRKSVV
jgi:hypothetical protein